jgi:hypothetical protein
MAWAGFRADTAMGALIACSALMLVAIGDRSQRLIKA